MGGQPLEPAVDDFWSAMPRLNISGAALSGAVSARQFEFDRGRHSGFRLYVQYSLNAGTSVNAILVSCESSPPIPQFQNISGVSAGMVSAGYAVEQYAAVPASGQIALRNVVYAFPTTSGASAAGAFWIPATPLQGQLGRISIGVSGTSHGSDAVSCYLGTCYV